MVSVAISALYARLPVTFWASCIDANLMQIGSPLATVTCLVVLMTTLPIY